MASSLGYIERRSIFDARVGRLTIVSHEVLSRGDVVYTGLVGWSGTKEGLCNAAEAAETRANARVGREIIIALPRACSLKDGIERTIAFANWFNSRFGSSIVFAIHHNPLKPIPNPHAHLLTTVRVVRDGVFCEKIRELDDHRGPSAFRNIRLNWAKILNVLLERERLPLVSEKSLKDQGIDRIPTVHEGPRFSLEHAINHERNRLILKINAQRKAKARAKAAEVMRQRISKYRERDRGMER